MKLLTVIAVLFITFSCIFADFSIVSTDDRNVVFEFDLLEGTNTYTIYISTVEISSTTYNQAERQFEFVYYSTYVYPVQLIYTFPQDFNGQYPLIEIYSVLVVETSWQFIISDVETALLEIQVIYQDVDNDGEFEQARNLDENISNGYESYRDLGLNSQVYRRVDWQEDSVFDFLVDTNLDGKPDILWIPHMQQIYKLLRRNIDRDSSAEYEVCGTNKFYDVSDNKFHTFCRIKGWVISNKNEPLSFANLSLTYDDNTPITSWSTDDFGNFDVYITTLTVDKYSILFVQAKGFLSQQQKLYLEHDEEYNVNFTLYPISLTADGVVVFPNPVKRGSVLNIVVKSSKIQKIKLFLLDYAGNFVDTLLDGEVASGDTEFHFDVRYPVGFYRISGVLGDKKILYNIEVVK